MSDECDCGRCDVESEWKGLPQERLDRLIDSVIGPKTGRRFRVKGLSPDGDVHLTPWVEERDGVGVGAMLEVNRSRLPAWTFTAEWDGDEEMSWPEDGISVS